MLKKILLIIVTMIFITFLMSACKTGNPTYGPITGGFDGFSSQFNSYQNLSAQQQFKYSQPKGDVTQQQQTDTTIQQDSKQDTTGETTGDTTGETTGDWTFDFGGIGF